MELAKKNNKNQNNNRANKEKKEWQRVFGKISKPFSGLIGFWGSIRTDSLGLYSFPIDQVKGLQGRRIKSWPPAIVVFHFGCPDNKY